MELYTLNINVSNQKLAFGENLPEIFSGDQSIDYVQFTFNDSQWDGFTDIWAVFNRYRGSSYQVELESGKAMIPAEVMINGGHIFIGLLGTDGENVQTSSVLEYSIGQGAANSDLIAPSESIYEQFLSDLDAYQTAVSELASIEARITTAEGDVTAIETDVESLEGRATAIETDVTAIQSAISTAQGNITVLQADVTNLQTSVTALESAVPTLQSSVSELQTNVTSLEGRLTTVSTSVGSLETRLATAQTEMTDLEDGLTDAEGRLTTIGNQITDAQTDIEEIETAIAQDNIVTDVTGGGVSFVDNHIADLSFMTVTDTATGSIATFPDGSGLNAVATEIEIEPKQAGSGTPSPDNVRAISGFSAVEVETVGRNLFNGSFNSVVPFKAKAVQVVASAELNGASYGVLRTYDENQTFIASTLLGTGSGTRKYGLITLSDNVAFVKFEASGGTLTEMQIEYGDTMHTYEAYNGIQTTINLGQTVYGATIYPEEGRGVITDGIISSYNGETLPSTWISDRDVYASGTTPTTGAQVCYELATPISFTFPAVNIPTLNGTNNVWADSGDISLEYIANLKKYIEKVVG